MAPLLQPSLEGSTNRGAILVQHPPPSLAGLDMAKRAHPDGYKAQLRDLQRQLKQVALACLAQGRRAVIVFEGRDAAGKGGAIRRISWPLDPRGLKVWPIAAPTPEEKGQHYLYRFWKRLPQPGQLVIFDRSWYGRVLVERVEGFATEPEWRRAYDEINEFERLLDDDGIRLVKIFLHITFEEQLERLRTRYQDPLKVWKLSHEDLRNRDRWPDYDIAIEEMFRKTSTEANPWTVVPANDKRYARLSALETCVERLSRGVDLSPRSLDPDLERRIRSVLGIG